MSRGGTVTLTKSIVMKRKVVKIVFLGLFLAVSSPLTSTTLLEHGAEESGGDTFDWNPVMDAIIQVESGGNPRAVSHKSCGAMQITPICVEQCNLILQHRGEDKRFSLDDRFSVEKSKEMFLLLQSHYNPTNNIEKAIRAWNGGPYYSVKRTQTYFEKVMARL